MPALREFARDQLAIAEERALRRRLTETERLGAGRVRRGGREYVSFSCNDYLGLTHHPARDRRGPRGAGAVRHRRGRVAAGHGQPSALCASSSRSWPR